MKFTIISWRIAKENLAFTRSCHHEINRTYQKLRWGGVILISLAVGSAAQAALVGHWTFEPGSELVDLTGNFGNLTLFYGANVSNGQLDVKPGQFARAIDYTGPTITNKTLVSWVYLDDLNVRSGSALTIDSPSVDRFDGIVYAERQPNRWMAGSSYFERTQDPVPGFAETLPNQLVQMAITYQSVSGNAHVSIYRNGSLIGDYTQGPMASWSAGDAEVLFGARHTLNGVGETRGVLDARIEEAMIFDEVLPQSKIQELTLTKSQAVPEPLTILGTGTALGFGAFFKRKLKPSKSTEKETTKVG